MYLDSNQEWENICSEDLWVYNKLFLSKILKYVCGPTGTIVPKSNYYIIRPSFNLNGMGRLARIEWIEKNTDNYHPSEFWCEIFTGRHLSVDFYKKESKLVILGEKDLNAPIYKWKKWSKIYEEIQFPSVLNSLKGNYDWINCEFIGDKLIEVHFRQNPDFRYGNTIAIPVWSEDEKIEMNNFKYIEDSEYLRKGFYIQ